MDGGEVDGDWSRREVAAVVDDDVLPERADIVPGDVVVRRHRPRRLLALAGVIVVLLAAGGGGLYLTKSRKPAKWEPEVVPLARFVENTRGGRFRKAVPIVFESDKVYKKHFASDGETPDKQVLEDMLGELRALGVVSGDLDLVKSGETLGAEGTAGFYSSEDHRIHVKGDRRDLKTVTLRTTLVHELTHAYDDQHFDLNFGEDPDKDSKATSGEEFGRTAVVEGSAQTVESEYVGSLSDADREKYIASFDDAAEKDPGRAKLDELPPVFTELFGLPYELGPRYLNGLRLARGAKGYGGAIDQAFRSAPVTEEQVLKPQATSEAVRLEKVAAPKVRAPEVAIKQDPSDADFGQVSLAIVLAPHVGTDEAIAAVDGWSGDAVTRYRPRKGGPSCIRVAVAFDSAAGAERFSRDAALWAAAIPGASVSPVAGSDRIAQLDACDPGAKGPAVKAASPTVTEALDLRIDIVSSFIESGVAAPGAQCVVDAAVARVGTTHLQELNERGDDPGAVAEIQSVFVPAAQQCHLGPA
jgi:hypothetical protein